mgnify:CR=1 FL=1
MKPIPRASGSPSGPKRPPSLLPSLWASHLTRFLQGKRAWIPSRSRPRRCARPPSTRSRCARAQAASASRPSGARSGARRRARPAPSRVAPAAGKRRRDRRGRSERAAAGRSAPRPARRARRRRRRSRRPRRLRPPRRGRSVGPRRRRWGPRGAWLLLDRGRAGSAGGPVGQHQHDGGEQHRHHGQDREHGAQGRTRARVGRGWCIRTSGHARQCGTRHGARGACVGARRRLLPAGAQSTLTLRMWLLNTKRSNTVRAELGSSA